MNESHQEAVTRVIALAVVAILLSLFAAALASSVDARPFGDSQAAGVKLAAEVPVPRVSPQTEARLAEEAAAEAEKKRKEAIEKKCQELKAKGVETASVTQNFPVKDTENTEERDLCVGVVRNTAGELQCVGKSAIVSMDSKGQGTIKSGAANTTEKGLCQTTYCDLGGKNCSPVETVSADQAADAAKKVLTDPEVFSKLTPDQQKSIASTLSSAERNEIIENAFKPAEARIQEQIKENNTTIDGIKKFLSGCTSVCNPMEVAEKENQLANLEKENKASEAQLKNLAAGKVVLTPSNNNQEPDPPSGPGQGPPGPAGPPGPSGPPGGGNPTGFGQPPGGMQGGGSPLENLLQKLLGGQQGGQGDQGKVCQPTVLCTSSTVYSRNSQCQDTAEEKCEFGCSKDGKSCAEKSDPNKCSNEPKKPAAEKCEDGSWEPKRNSKECITGWKCDPKDKDAVTPTAEISCQPTVADVGMTVAVTYGCSEGKSEGDGFDTGGAKSGSATVTLSDPAAGSNKAFFGVTCTEEKLSDLDTCEIQVGKPGIVLVANPQAVEMNATAQIGWVTSGMASCTISSPDQPNFTGRNASSETVSGTAETDPISASIEIMLTCTTLGGQTRESSTTVTVGGSVGV